jgi:phosphate transport system ATP-binding protein
MIYMTTMVESKTEEENEVILEESINENLVKSSESESNKILVRNVHVYYSEYHAIKDVSMDIHERSVTAFIGPSGCGKSTLLRCFNRMNQEIVGCRMEGKIIWGGVNILGDKVDPVSLRRDVGMVFQKPNPFPKSIYQNVAYGPKIHGVRKKEELDRIVEKSLRDVGVVTDDR